MGLCWCGHNLWVALRLIELDYGGAKEPLIITYTNLLHRCQDVNAKEAREFLEQHKYNKTFIQRAETLNELFVTLRVWK